jgi:SAM-dependent methyltransferase
MENFNRKAHWEHIYQTKELNERSWFQEKPETSLHLIEIFGIPTNAKIIDIGGGDSLLVDHLLDLGYEHVSVLDISSAAIERAKRRLGDRANKVQWIVSDVLDFQPYMKYDYWHDRAAFHFLTDGEEIREYISKVETSLSSNGILSIAAFSESGPAKCSGIHVKQYSIATMSEHFDRGFNNIHGFYIDHHTPFETIQNFVVASFKPKTQSL